MPRVSAIRKWVTKWSNWEFWPFSLVYFPVFFYYGWLIIRTRSFFFFTASNPCIEFGGMFGEKKSDIFELIPDEYIPKTFLIAKGDITQVTKLAPKVGYPLIAKPNIGERGAWVEKISTESELISYAESCPVDFLIQELVSYPLELGVFYIRYPDQEGKVTSIVRKEFLEVVGDGQSTIIELLSENPRALLQADFKSSWLIKEGHQVPDKGEQVTIEPIGNHCRGTKFLNDGNQIDNELTQAFNRLAATIPDFYFGRFDLKCQSIEDLKQLKNFKILELNGAGSEPGHIYQPGFSLFRAYKDILWHLRVLADISIENHKRGVPYWGFRPGYRKWKSHQKHNRLLYNS